MHGDIMHTGDMLQRAEGRNLQSQAHHLIDIFPAEIMQEPPVFLAGFKACRLLRGQKCKIIVLVPGKDLPLLLKEELQNRQVKEASRGVGRTPCGKIVFRVQDVAYILIGIGHPAAFRFSSEKVQRFGAQVIDFRAGKSSPHRKHPCHVCFPVFPVHQHPDPPGCHTGSTQKLFVGKLVGQPLHCRFHMFDPHVFPPSVTLFVHLSRWLFLRVSIDI